MTVVTTKDELAAAKKRGDTEIVVKGDLANHLKKAKKITATGAGALIATGIIGLIAAPVTGGLSVGLTAGQGAAWAAIITASGLSLALIIAVFRDYEEVSFTASGQTLTLRKKGAPKTEG